MRRSEETIETEVHLLSGPEAVDQHATPMHVRSRGVPIEEPVQGYVRRRLERRLGRFTRVIERVSVRFTDLNGPRGGVDTSCRMKVVLRGMETVFVERTHHDVRAAFDLALDGARQAVRASTRRKYLAPRRPSRGWRRERIDSGSAPEASVRDARTKTSPDAAAQSSTSTSDTQADDAQRVDEHIDEALTETFPASDAPPWTLGPPRWTRAGA